MYEKTDFGSGRAAKWIYGIGSVSAWSIVFGIVVGPARAEYDVSIKVVGAIASLMLVMITGFGGSFFARRHKRSNQQKRDQRARFVLGQARKGRTSDYSLYLRSFSTTGQMPAPDMSDPVEPPLDFRYSDSQVVDLEAVFAEVLESCAPVVALGKPDERIGAGRIETDDDRWKDDLEVLAENALLLLVLPSPGSSLQWEIEWIMLHGHLKKAMFVMPPKNPWGFSLPGGSKGVRWEEVWPTLRAWFDEKGSGLPPYEKAGMIFFLEADGTISAKANLRGSLAPRWVAKKVENLLKTAAERMKSAAGGQL